MAEKRKSSTVDDIINGYQKFHHKTGRKFEERIKQFEKFHDPDNIHAKQLMHHAQYVVFGKETNRKEFPGAFHAAYAVLDRHYVDDDARVKDDDKLTEILETLADTFLEKEMGKGYKKELAHAEKAFGLAVANEKNAKEAEEKRRELRLEFKGGLLGKYHPDDKGNPGNIFSESYRKNLKGKTKVDVIDQLMGLSEQIKQTYAAHLHGKALEGLISDEDKLPMAEYITPIFEERGWRPKKPHIMRSAGQQSDHYGALLVGAGDQLKKMGYKTIKYEKKEKKK